MPTDRHVATFSEAVSATKADGLLRLISITATSALWYSVSLAALLLYLRMPQEIGTLLQVASAAGLAPLAAVVATWRAVEWLLTKWMNHYVRTHVRER